MYILIFIFWSYHFSEVNSYSIGSAWSKLTHPLKNKARNWFITRAETLGIPWNDLTKYYKKQDVQLIKNKIRLEQLDIVYPSYYTMPFHGYEKGNLDWLPAYENTAATLNIAAGYWPNANVEEAQNWMRFNSTDKIKKYLEFYPYNEYDGSYNLCDNDPIHPAKILDIGCSVGISSEYLKEAFPKSHVTGLDLSPYFLSIAQHRNQLNGTYIDYVHANAEDMPFKSSTYDLVTCNFLFHEVPYHATRCILNEIIRVLKPNGVIAIVDVEPDIVNNKKNNLLGPMRKWMFEVTEPHIYNYYERSMKTQLKDIGFSKVQKKQNDPVNSVWIGTSNGVKFHEE